MLKSVPNLLLVIGLGVVAYPFITGKDITGVPTSTATMACDVIAGHFIGQGIDMGQRLYSIQRVDRLEVLERTERTLTCRGLAFLDGSPSTYVRLTSVENSPGDYALGISQALPADYTCDLLAHEITMKFSQEPRAFGFILSITDATAIAGNAPIRREGRATFSSGLTLKTQFSFDGKVFSVLP